MKLLRFAIILLPAAFVGLTIVYKDSFYILLALGSLLFSILVIFPSVLNKKVIVKNIKFSNELIKGEENVVEDVVEDLKKERNYYNPRYAIGILFLLFTLLFSYIGVFKLYSAHNAQNIFIEYYQNQLIFFKPFLLFLFTGVLLASYILSIVIMKHKRKHKGRLLFTPRYFPISIVLVSGILIGGLLFSLISSYLFGLGEVNYIALKTKLYPTSAGITIGKDAVINKLQSTKDNISIVGSDNNVKSTILSQLIKRDIPQESFYLQRIIKTIPQSLTLAIESPKESLIMVGNDLIINQINKDDIEAVSPTIGKIMLTRFFKSRYLKENKPKIILMGRQEYLTFREQQIDEQVAKLDDALAEVKDYISDTYGSISNAKQKIAYNQNGISEAESLRESAYNRCTSAGYSSFYTGTFYRYYSDAQCESQRNQWNQTIAQYQKNINDWNANLRYYQKELSDYQGLSEYLTDIRGIVDSQRDATPQELGVFEPENNIKVVLDSTSPKAIDNYLETLTHEYLHYASYISDERTLDHFFEEGLTEYYARKTVKQNLGVDINLGYPLISKLIEQMMKKIPENTLQDIYFTKDQKRLSALLDDAYGKNFYEDTELYFTTISYAPYDKALKIANNIMYRIGGKELTEKDLYSTSVSN